MFRTSGVAYKDFQIVISPYANRDFSISNAFGHALHGAGAKFYLSIEEAFPMHQNDHIYTSVKKQHSVKNAYFPKKSTKKTDFTITDFSIIKQHIMINCDRMPCCTGVKDFKT